jgi:hypothetical protein
MNFLKNWKSVSLKSLQGGNSGLEDREISITETSGGFRRLQDFVELHN